MSSFLDNLSVKIKCGDKRGSREAFELVKKEFQTWLEKDSPVVEEQEGKNDHIEVHVLNVLNDGLRMPHATLKWLCICLCTG